jgi:hypothetical protein
MALPEFYLGYLGELKRLLLRTGWIAPGTTTAEWEHLLNFGNIGGGKVSPCFKLEKNPEF